MLRLASRYWTLETLSRVFADAALVNVSYFFALVIRPFLTLDAGQEFVARQQLDAALASYGEHGWLLTLISLLTFIASGFYSRGRFYRSRFKILVLTQAVTASYVIFGFCQYIGFAKNWLSMTPRVAMALGWALTLSAIIGARLWSVIWRVVVHREDPLNPSVNRVGPIRRVLIIGGAGYIGSVLTRQLLAQGYSVRVLDALVYGRDSLKGLENESHFELVEGDSRDIGAIFSAMLETDAVIHLGEIVGDPACALDEKLTLEVNLAATRMLAEAARGYGVKRFVYASSCSVYGAAESTLDERSVLNPVSLYARAKIGCEKILLGMNRDDFNPIILRLATVFGLSYRPRFDLVVNLLTAKAVQDGQITVFGGNQWRPFVHVADVARAMIRCLQMPLASVKGEVFNVGSNQQNFTIGQIGELVQTCVPQARLVNQGGADDNRNYRVSFDKIHNVMNFACQYPLEAGIREIAAALRQGTIDDYQSVRYSNQKTLSDPAGQMLLKAHPISELYAADTVDQGTRAAVVPLRGK